MLAGDVLWWWQLCSLGLAFQDSGPHWGMRRSTAQSVRCRLVSASGQCVQPPNTICCTCSEATSAFPGACGSEEWAWAVSGSHMAKEMGLGDHTVFTHSGVLEPREHGWLTLAVLVRGMGACPLQTPAVWRPAATQGEMGSKHEYLQRFSSIFKWVPTR